MKITDYLKSRKVWNWLALASAVLGLIGLIIYLVAGRTQFDPDYSTRAIVGLALGVAAGLAAALLSFRAAYFVQYLLFLFGFLSYITSQMNLLGNLLYNVDGSTLPAAFILITVFTLAACVLPLVAGILDRKRAAEAA